MADFLEFRRWCPFLGFWILEASFRFWILVSSQRFWIWTLVFNVFLDSSLRFWIFDARVRVLEFGR